jgi:hypothetical protein
MGCLPVWVGLLALVSVAFSPKAHAARIVAEKNCSVRIDDELRPGQKVFVVRTQGGKQRKVAIVQISRSGKGLSLGKVIQGPRPCASLKGLAVESARGPKGKSAGPGAKGLALLPALDAELDFQYIMFSGSGLHQRTDQSVPSLSLFGLGVQADVWPGLFVDRKSLLWQAFGLGVRYSQAQAVPEIDVAPPPESPDQTPGKQQSTPSTLLVEVAGRYPYMDGKLATELRVGYLMHSIEHTLTTRGALPRPPLRNVAYSGLTIGVKQRVRLIDVVRANLGVTIPVMLAGSADNSSERTADRTATYAADVKEAGGFLIDASVDGILRMFKGTLGLTYETYGAKLDLAEGGSVTLDQTSIILYIGAGVFL